MRNGGVQVLVTRPGYRRRPVSARPRHQRRPRRSRSALLSASSPPSASTSSTIRSRTCEEIERIARPCRSSAPSRRSLDWRNRQKPRLVTIEDPGSTGVRGVPRAANQRAVRRAAREAHVLQISSPGRRRRQDDDAGEPGGHAGARGPSASPSSTAICAARACTSSSVRRTRSDSLRCCSVTVPCRTAVQTLRLPSGASINLLASGPLPPNPAELAGHARVAELLAALRGRERLRAHRRTAGAAGHRRGRAVVTRRRHHARRHRQGHQSPPRWPRASPTFKRPTPRCSAWSSTAARVRLRAGYGYGYYYRSPRRRLGQRRGTDAPTVG